MDARHLLQAAVWLFAIAAAGGGIMAGIRFAGHRNPPAWLSMLHGLLAAAGLTLTLYAAFVGEERRTSAYAPQCGGPVAL